MALPEETWRSDFTGLGWREELGLTLFQRNKGRARAASLSSAQRKTHHPQNVWQQPFVRSWPKTFCVRMFVSLQAHNLLVLDYWEVCVCVCVCLYAVIWLLLIWVCIYFKCLSCISRNRQCEEKVCCSSPQTLEGAHRFHSPCRQCAGSAKWKKRNIEHSWYENDAYE